MSVLRMAAVVVLCGVPDVAYAAEIAGVSTGTLFFKTTLILASVCLLAVASLRWVLPRFAGQVARGGTRMKVLERLDLGGSAALVLVDVDGRTLLIGHAGNDVKLLEKAPDDVSRETLEGLP